MLCYIYQCSIPVFEGLLPEPFNGMVLRLLYKTAEWHALAKLRIHTDSTLNLFDVVTREFGRLMRQFRDRTADEFDTVELPHEAGCQEIGLVAFMFFFELLFSYVSLQFPSMFLLLTYSQSFFSLSADHPRHSRQRRSKISILLIQETV